ncbi:hypothetical protein EDB85DRAFT_1895416 [Lactarius pseudohatsudake]|nr:hypothetical protein EDB85DRAFT_1895416 [Lactarius pseudohatsudake]
MYIVRRRLRGCGCGLVTWRNGVLACRVGLGWQSARLAVAGCCVPYWGGVVVGWWLGCWVRCWGGGGSVSQAMSGRHAGAGPSGDDSHGWQGPATFRCRGGMAGWRWWHVASHDRGGVLRWGQMEVASVHEGAAMACNV